MGKVWPTVRKNVWYAKKTMIDVLAVGTFLVLALIWGAYIWGWTKRELWKWQLIGSATGALILVILFALPNFVYGYVLPLTLVVTALGSLTLTYLSDGIVTSVSFKYLHFLVQIPFYGALFGLVKRKTKVSITIFVILILLGLASSVVQYLWLTGFR